MASYQPYTNNPYDQGQNPYGSTNPFENDDNDPNAGLSPHNQQPQIQKSSLDIPPPSYGMVRSATLPASSSGSSPNPNGSLPPSMSPSSSNSQLPEQAQPTPPNHNAAVPAKYLEEVTPTEALSKLDKRYYQAIFQIDEELLVMRLRNTLFWCSSEPFYADEFQPQNPRAAPLPRLRINRPDLYGPFWITTTLVLLLGVLASITQNDWVVDMNKISWSASIFYTGLLLPPIVWYIVLRCSDAYRPLFHIISYYGYSFFIYIPMAILALIPIDWIDVIACVIAFIMSTGFLLRNVYQWFVSHQEAASRLQAQQVLAAAAKTNAASPTAVAAATAHAEANGTSVEAQNLDVDGVESTVSTKTDPDKIVAAVLLIGITITHAIIATACYFVFFRHKNY